MNVKLIAMLTALFSLTCPALAKRNRSPIGGPVSSDTSGHSEKLTFTDLQKICNPQIVGNFNNWFPNWMAQYVLLNRFMTPTQMGQELRMKAKQHIDDVRKYLEAFEAQLDKIQSYSNLYFEAELKDLLTRVGHATHPYPNSLDEEKQVQALQSEVGPSVDDIIQRIADSETDATTVNLVGDMFKTEKTNFSKSSSSSVAELIPTLTESIIKALKSILSVFAEPDDGPRYSKLDSAQREVLQSFYDKFSDLLDEKEKREQVFTFLIGKDRKDGGYSGKFFADRVFNKIKAIGSVTFNRVFARDAFLLNYNKDFKLADLHTASQKLYFTWDFPELFDISANEVPIEGEPKPKTPEAKLKRKWGRLYVMFYKVYCILRAEGIVDPEFSPDRVAVLRKMLKWVEETKDFEDIPTDEFGLAVRAPPVSRQILLPSKFNRHVLPLWTLICSKIPDCNPDLSKNPDYLAIFERYKSNNSFEDLKKNPTIQSLVHPGTIAFLRDKLIENEFKKFEDVLDELISNNPSIKDPVFPQKDSENSQKTPNVKPERSLVPKIDPKVQSEFNKKVGERFLVPNDDTPLEDRVKIFEGLMDTIDGTQNINKKAALRTLLITFLVQSFKSDKKKVTDLITKVVPKMLAKIRASLSFEYSEGFRNYMALTMGTGPIGYGAQVKQYVPRSDMQSIIYILDFIFFVEFPLEDEEKKLQLNTNQVSKDTGLEEKEVRGKQIKELKQTLVDNFYGRLVFREGSEKGTDPKLLKRTLTLSPLFLELLPQVDFMVNFLDFFSYYAPSGSPKAIFANYNSVFLTFYSFLSQVRTKVVSEVASPYQHVLGQLERCLALTESLNSRPDLKDLDGICQLSHRKYSEIYFFYKLYLIQKNKPIQVGISERPEARFSVHTRLFLLYTQQNPHYKRILGSLCEKRSGADGDSICVSWRIYQKYLQFVSEEKILPERLAEEIKDLAQDPSFPTRIHILNGLEALKIHISTSEMIKWDRDPFLLKAISYDGRNTLYAQLKFRPEDRDDLARYLKRTYMKLSIGPNEKMMDQVVQGILKTSIEKQDGTLRRFLQYGDTFIPLYVKIFLQFANSDAQFLHIADLLIAEGISTELIELNDTKNDEFFLSLPDKIQALKNEDPVDFLKKQLSAKYKELIDLASQVSQNTLSHEVSTSGELDAIADAMDKIAEEVLAAELTENDNFQTKIVPEIKQTVSKITRSEKEAVKETAFVTEVKHLRKPIVLNSRVYKPKEQKDFKIELDFGFEESVDKRSVREESSSKKPVEQRVLSGVGMIPNQVGLVNRLSQEIISQIKHKIETPGERESVGSEKTGLSEQSPSKIDGSLLLGPNLMSRENSAEKNRKMVSAILETITKSDKILGFSRDSLTKQQEDSDKKERKGSSSVDKTESVPNKKRPNRQNHFLTAGSRGRPTESKKRLV